MYCMRCMQCILHSSLAHELIGPVSARCSSIEQDALQCIAGEAHPWLLRSDVIQLFRRCQIRLTHYGQEKGISGAHSRSKARLSLLIKLGHKIILLINSGFSTPCQVIYA